MIPKSMRFAAMFLTFSLLSSSCAYAASDFSAPEISEALLELNSDSTLPETQNWTVDVSDLPAKLDLRDRGVVPEVRDQDPWGTCWGFGSIAASEISILSDLGLTCEEFKEKYGYDLDLSERHLAWYGTYHLPESADQNEDMTDTELSQLGEGFHNIAEETDSNTAHYNRGGFAAMASSVFAAGIGPVLESDVPYTANDGSKSTKSDWSVSEDTRFITAFDLLDSNLYPSPAKVDEDTSEYTYNEAATNAIKRELNKGHGVAISYYADDSEPDDSDDSEDSEESSQSSKGSCKSSLDDSELEEIYDEILDMDFSEDEADTAMTFFEEGSYEDMSEDDRYTAAEVCIYLLASDDEFDDLLEEFYEGDLSSEDILDEVLYELDDTETSLESSLYMNTKTYAQYTYKASEESNHVVCIIGYDDNYSADNFLEGHQPPADGAWIVRNSWGSDWGNDGYFYLSYYDQTISEPESFVFDVSDFDLRTEDLTILNYDFMQVSGVNAVLPEGSAASACIFNVDEKSVLSSANILTAVQDTTAEVSVYLLNEDNKTPEDGELLDTQTVEFPYAGYHRINLTNNYVIPENSRLSIVVSQVCKKDGKDTAVLPINMELSKTGAEEDGTLTAETAWSEASINEGESFVCDNGTWADWKTVIDETTAADDFSEVVFDNPSLKLYLYPYDEVEEIHHLDDTTTDADGNTVAVCDEDDYTVIFE